MRVMGNPKRGQGAAALGGAAALLLLLAGAPAPAADDPFAAMEVQRAAREVAAPAFRLRTPEGKPLALEDQKGKVVAFYFWRTW